MTRRLSMLAITIAAVVLAACASPTSPSRDCGNPGVGLGSGQCH